MKYFYTILFFFILSCTTKNVVKHHGVHFLDKKYTKLEINSTNQNDLLKLLGKPSTKSSFDNDVWIYIERKFTTGSIFKLGAEKILVNNVLVVEIDNNGLLADKKLYTKESMKDLKITDGYTSPVYSKRSFVYDFLSSMRQKINRPATLKKN